MVDMPLYQTWNSWWFQGHLSLRGGCSLFFFFFFFFPSLYCILFVYDVAKLEKSSDFFCFLSTSYLKNHPRWIRHMGHCWRSKDKLMSDVLLWTPTHGHTSVGWPTRTYLHQLCVNTGCSLKELPGAMDL